MFQVSTLMDSGKPGLDLDTAFLDVIFDLFRAEFFCSENQWDTQFFAYLFSFILASLFVFLHSTYVYASISHRSPAGLP